MCELRAFNYVHFTSMSAEEAASMWAQYTNTRHADKADRERARELVKRPELLYDVIGSLGVTHLGFKWTAEMTDDQMEQGLVESAVYSPQFWLDRRKRWHDDEICHTVLWQKYLGGRFTDSLNAEGASGSFTGRLDNVSGLPYVEPRFITLEGREERQEAMKRYGINRPPLLSEVHRDDFIRQPFGAARESHGNGMEYRHAYAASFGGEEASFFRNICREWFETQRKVYNVRNDLCEIKCTDTNAALESAPEPSWHDPEFWWGKAGFNHDTYRFAAYHVQPLVRQVTASDGSGIPVQNADKLAEFLRRHLHPTFRDSFRKRFSHYTLPKGHDVKNPWVSVFDWNMIGSTALRRHMYYERQRPVNVWPASMFKVLKETHQLIIKIGGWMGDGGLRRLGFHMQHDGRWGPWQSVQLAAETEARARATLVRSLESLYEYYRRTFVPDPDEQGDRWREGDDEVWENEGQLKASQRVSRAYTSLVHACQATAAAHVAREKSLQHDETRAQEQATRQQALRARVRKLAARAILVVAVTWRMRYRTPNAETALYKFNKRSDWTLAMNWEKVYGAMVAIHRQECDITYDSNRSNKGQAHRGTGVSAQQRRALESRAFLASEIKRFIAEAKTEFTNTWYQVVSVKRTRVTDSEGNESFAHNASPEMRLRHICMSWHRLRDSRSALWWHLLARGRSYRHVATFMDWVEANDRGCSQWEMSALAGNAGMVNGINLLQTYSGRWGWAYLENLTLAQFSEQTHTANGSLVEPQNIDQRKGMRLVNIHGKFAWKASHATGEDGEELESKEVFNRQWPDGYGSWYRLKEEEVQRGWSNQLSERTVGGWGTASTGSHRSWGGPSPSRAVEHEHQARMDEQHNITRARQTAERIEDELDEPDDGNDGGEWQSFVQMTNLKVGHVSISAAVFAEKVEQHLRIQTQTEEPEDETPLLKYLGSLQRPQRTAREAVPPHLEHLTEWRGLTDGVSLQHLVELASERFQWRRVGSGARDAERSREDRYKDDKQTQTELASERFQWRREGSGAGDAERSLEDRHKDDKQTQTEGT